MPSVSVAAFPLLWRPDGWPHTERSRRPHGLACSEAAGEFEQPE